MASFVGRWRDVVFVYLLAFFIPALTMGGRTGGSKRYLSIKHAANPGPPRVASTRALFACEWREACASSNVSHPTETNAVSEFRRNRPSRAVGIG
jgi:hypothetical protein